MDAVELVQHG